MPLLLISVTSDVIGLGDVIISRSDVICGVTDTLGVFNHKGLQVAVCVCALNEAIIKCSNLFFAGFRVLLLDNTIVFVQNKKRGCWFTEEQCNLFWWII